MAQLIAEIQTATEVPVFINTRFQDANLSGVQRYAAELLRRIGARLTPIAPRQAAQGLKGHLWEQTILPALARNGLLWSPANSGPLAVKRQVLTVHDVASIEHPEWYNRAFAAWYRYMTPQLVRRVQRVITPSEFSKQRLVALTGVHESRVVVIPGGIDSRFCPQPRMEVERVRQVLRIPSTDYVLTVSTLEPRKNLHRLLSAWASCVLDIPDKIWLVVAGQTGSSRVFHRSGIDSVPPRVHFTGFVAENDLPALYSGALAVAYVSLYEGFGLPALEAMACGTVPVVSGNTALPEVVGEAGLLVNPFDSDSIANGIRRISEQIALREDLEIRAIERSKEFSWDRCADLTWDVIRAELQSVSRTYSKDGDCKAPNAGSSAAA